MTDVNVFKMFLNSKLKLIFNMNFHELSRAPYYRYRRCLRFAVANIRRIPVTFGPICHICDDVHPQFDDFEYFKIRYWNYRRHMQVRYARTSSTYKSSPHEAFKNRPPPTSSIMQQRSPFSSPTHCTYFLHQIST